MSDKEHQLPKDQDPVPKTFAGWLQSPLFIAVLALVSGALGAYIQRNFDVFDTNRELAIRYSDEASASAKRVDQVMQVIVQRLGNSSSEMPAQKVEELRAALLDLHSSAERLAIQTGKDGDVFEGYAEAMADLASAAEATTGPGSAKPFFEALNAYLVRKSEFDRSVAAKYNPDSG